MNTPVHRQQRMRAIAEPIPRYVIRQSCVLREKNEGVYRPLLWPNFENKALVSVAQHAR
jgi:hypothetical protein